MCASSCKTQDHETFGECLRAQSLRVAYCQSASGRDATAQKKWDRDLDAYESAVKQGIHPETTQRRDVERAVKISDQTGQAFRSHE